MLDNGIPGKIKYVAWRDTLYQPRETCFACVHRRTQSHPETFHRGGLIMSRLITVFASGLVDLANDLLELQQDYYVMDSMSRCHPSCKSGEDLLLYAIVCMAPRVEVLLCIELSMTRAY